MKKLVAINIIAILLSINGFAQKVVYVDSDYILENIPEYTAGKKELDNISIEWQKQIEAKYAQIDKMYKDYQAEQVLLTDEMRKKRENEIINKEKEAKDFQKSKFGVEGELFKKRQEIIKPIQDNIYNAIKELAELSRYGIVFDKANQSNILFSNPKLDKSKAVLKKLGYTAKKK